jgi:hypothetical protein
MTDFTTDTPMIETRSMRSGHKREYIAYFAVIFIATLPLACLTWLLTATRQMRLPEKGPIKAAWSQANIITPIIFSA